MSDLPELTDEERAALDACDMTEILGTWEERFHIAKNAAIRWLRERDKARNERDWARAAARLMFRELRDGGMNRWKANDFVTRHPWLAESEVSDDPVP